VTNIETIIKKLNLSSDLTKIANKILSNESINEDDALCLFQCNNIGLLGLLANFLNEQKNGNTVFYNRNIHIEPTNICINRCKFCAYAREKGDDNAWCMDIPDILNEIRKHIPKKITEVHIVGGVHPDRDLSFYTTLLENIKKEFPHLHIKAFTAPELDFMFKKSGVSDDEGILQLKKAGLNSIPGGGAELFNPEIRKQLCPEKISGERWLEIHKKVHAAGIPSNATMLYGHLEKYEQRIDHLKLLRHLQNETNGFQAFIPLKYRNQNNLLKNLPEISLMEDLKNYAVSRIYLNNFRHLKAYWPMIGLQTAQIALHFGVNDLDGTIDDTTKIYEMAGVKEKSKLSADEIIHIASEMGKEAVERDSLYNLIQ
jgi:aminodeoxyfutalosine synthase